MTTWVNQLSIGSHLEISDKYERWCIGIVEEIKDAHKKIKISYFGWNSKWTEWIHTSSDNINRIAPLNTHIVPITFCEPPKPIEHRYNFQSSCCISTDCIFCAMISPFENKIIIEKYFKLSNQYKRAEILTNYRPKSNWVKNRYIAIF